MGLFSGLRGDVLGGVTSNFVKGLWVGFKWFCKVVLLVMLWMGFTYGLFSGFNGGVMGGF